MASSDDLSFFRDAARAAEPDRANARFGRSFQAGETLFREGEAGTEAFLLEEGSVRLAKRVRGVERNLMVMKPGDLFGESALIDGAARSTTAVALTAGMALVLDIATFQVLLKSDPNVAVRVVRELARRLRDAEDQLEIMMLSDTQSKVVAALLKLALETRSTSVGAGAAPPGASFLTTPMELSSRVGLDVDTVKRTVQQLREGQYIRVTEERLEVPDIDALKKLYALLGVKDDVRGEA